jgi:hypothetical protein
MAHIIIIIIITVIRLLKLCFLTSEIVRKSFDYERKSGKMKDRRDMK